MTGKYLDGMPLIDEQGLVRDISVRGITVEGRLFLQRLKAEEKAESFIGRLRKPGSFIAGTVFGALATMIPDLVKLWFFPK